LIKPLQRFLKWLLSVPQDEQSLGQIVIWWEKRRIPYNLIIGMIGFISLLLFFLFISKSGELQPGEDAVEPMALFIAPILMNVGYTLGWFVEGLLRIFKRTKFRRVSQELMQVGLFFSVAVVILPTAYWFLRFLWAIVTNSIH
jgi:hypothetical protein